MLAPKRTKYRKSFKGRIKGNASRGTQINFGESGLKALSTGRISSRQIEAARKAMTRYTQKGGRVFIRIFPDKPITKKPAETRMGGGKGDVVGYVAPVQPGRILFEMSGIPHQMMTEALTRAAAKLSISTGIVFKGELHG